MKSEIMYAVICFVLQAKERRMSKCTIGVCVRSNTICLDTIVRTCTDDSISSAHEMLEETD